jgi:hypothetical protein
MEKQNNQITFNNINYDIINHIKYKDRFYYLIYDEKKYKIVYEFENEFYQVINNKEYKELFNRIFIF